MAVEHERVYNRATGGVLLYAGGVMNLAVIAALTACVAFERLAPLGLHTARITGGVLMAAGLWLLAR